MLYVGITSGAVQINANEARVIMKGDKFLGSHVLVRNAPRMFVTADAPSDAVWAVVAERFNGIA